MNSELPATNYLLLSTKHMEVITEKKVKRLEFIANQLRQDVIRMVSGAGSGHIAGPLDMADIFAAMYFHILRHDPKNPPWPDPAPPFLSNRPIFPLPDP